MPDNFPLLWAILFGVILTLIAKIAPISILKGDNLPAKLKKWLDFVPVAVMAALVGPDIFIYEGKFNPGFSNLFLIVSIPTLLVAWLTKNYFVTIASGIGLIIVARYFGYS